MWVFKVIIVNRVFFTGFFCRLLLAKYVFALSNYRRFKMLIKHVVFSEQHVECLMMTTCTPAIYLCTLLTRRFNWFLSWHEWTKKKKRRKGYIRGLFNITKYGCWTIRYSIYSAEIDDFKLQGNVTSVRGKKPFSVQ